MSFINNLRISATPSSEKSLNDIMTKGYKYDTKPHYIKTAEEEKAYHDYWIQEKLERMYGKPNQKKFVRNPR